MVIVFYLVCSCGEDIHQQYHNGTNVNQGGTSSEEILPLFDEVSSYQLRYISSLVSGGGAILKDGGNSVNPYFSNFAALALLTDPTIGNIDIVKNYIDWYLGHLNGSQKPNGQDEIPGSIYDYTSGGTVSTGDYDSVDSYAATFLMLVEQLLEASPQDKSWILERSSQIALVSSAMVSCIDTESAKVAGSISPENDDYLSVAKMEYDAKYLMDNCEVNRGLKSAIALQNKGVFSDSVDYESILAKNSSGIESLWIDDAGTYKWFESPTCISNWQRFYPDAVAQLWPVMFGVIDPASKRAKDIYNSFQTAYPLWAEGHTYITHPWTAVFFAAACMGDEVSVKKYIKHLQTFSSQNKQKDYWYCAEAAWTVLAIDKYTASQ